MKKYKLRNYDNSIGLKENLLNNRDISDLINKTSIDIPNIKNLDLFIDRIKKAIKLKECIGILHDSDMDGISGGTILYKALTTLPKCKCIHTICCDRANGYGILKEYYDEMNRLGITLVITADVGISNKNEIEYGKYLGIETLCTDHHPFEIPPDCIYINPADSDNLDITPYCGGGLVYILMKALYNELGYGMIFDEDYSLLSLATIATIGDMVPLIKDNYILVKQGLKAMLHTDNLPIKWLVDNVIYDNDRDFLVSTDISFGIAPLVNALNRISSPTKAIDFLTSNDIYEIETLGRYMIDNNNKRKQLQIKAIKEAISRIEKTKLYKNNFIFLDLDIKHTFAGLVASYITSDYLHKPAIVVSKNSDGTYYGSGRSLANCRLAPLIKLLSPYCVKIGGHDFAAGLSFTEDNKQIIDNIIGTFSNQLSEEDLSETEYVECKLELSDINDDLIREIYSLEPYGMANKAPIFYSNNVQIANIECKNFNTFFQLENQTSFFDFTGIVSLKGVSFKKDYTKDISIGDIVSIIYSINPDKSLLIKEIKKIDNNSNF